MAKDHVKTRYYTLPSVQRNTTVTHFSLLAFVVNIRDFGQSVHISKSQTRARETIKMSGSRMDNTADSVDNDRELKKFMSTFMAFTRRQHRNYWHIRKGQWPTKTFTKPKYSPWWGKRILPVNSGTGKSDALGSESTD